MSVLILLRALIIGRRLNPWHIRKMEKNSVKMKPNTVKRTGKLITSANIKKKYIKV